MPPALDCKEVDVWSAAKFQSAAQNGQMARLDRALETPTESDFVLSRRNRSVGSCSALLVAKDVREPVKAGAVAFIYVHSPE